MGLTRARQTQHPILKPYPLRLHYLRWEYIDSNTKVEFIKSFLKFEDKELALAALYRSLDENCYNMLINDFLKK